MHFTNILLISGLLTVSHALHVRRSEGAFELTSRQSASGTSDPSAESACTSICSTILATVQSCATTPSCLCTAPNEAALQKCLNCLVSVRPELSASDVATQEQDVNTVVSGFNAACSPSGVPTLTVAADAATSTGLTGGDDPDTDSDIGSFSTDSSDDFGSSDIGGPTLAPSPTFAAGGGSGSSFPSPSAASGSSSGSIGGGSTGNTPSAAGSSGSGSSGGSGSTGGTIGGSGNSNENSGNSNTPSGQTGQSNQKSGGLQFIPLSLVTLEASVALIMVMNMLFV